MFSSFLPTSPDATPTLLKWNLQTTMCMMELYTPIRMPVSFFFPVIALLAWLLGPMEYTRVDLETLIETVELPK
jgi:hypothetical protein